MFRMHSLKGNKSVAMHNFFFQVRGMDLQLQSYLLFKMHINSSGLMIHPEVHMPQSFFFSMYHAYTQ